MMGHHRFAVRLYYQLSLEDLVPKNHLLRRIANVNRLLFYIRAGASPITAIRVSPRLTRSFSSKPCLLATSTASLLSDASWTRFRIISLFAGFWATTWTKRFRTTAYCRRPEPDSACRSSRPSSREPSSYARMPAWSTEKRPSSTRLTCGQMLRCRR